MSYNAKKQEKFFQTRRIQIGEHRERGAKRPNKYTVLMRDVIRDPAKYVCWYRIQVAPSDETAGCWSDRIPSPEPIWAHPRGYVYRKYDALAIAQREALRLNLPFDPKTDVLDMEEIQPGPLQNCLVCGESAGKRAHQPLICERCKSALAAGQDALQMQARQLVGIEARDLLPYFLSGNKWEMSLGLAATLLRLTGAQLLDLLDYPQRGSAARIIRSEQPNDGNWVQGTYLSDGQADLFEQAIRQIRALLDNARAVGQGRGESLLLGLASGDLSVAEFNDRTIHKDR